LYEIIFFKKLLMSFPVEFGCRLRQLNSQGIVSNFFKKTFF
jgi:hypothetical protein